MELEPTNEVEMDLPPEYCRYQDDGCELATAYLGDRSSCLNCPFTGCVYDEPGGKQRWIKRLRDREMARLFTTEGKGIKGIGLLEIRGGEVDMPVKKGLLKAKEGLPKEAFAIVGDPEDPETWKLPHHRKSILRALQGKLDIEKTVDWERVPAAVAALSPGGYRGQRVDASPEEILQAAKHLAAHYQKADKPLPDILAALV